MRGSSCKNMDATCPKGSTCRAICSEEDSCMNIDLNGNWEVECAGKMACKNTQAECTPNCGINCKGRLACMNIYATCPNGSKCRAICSNDNTCHNSTFIGHWKTDCTGAGSCEQTRSIGTPTPIIINDQIGMFWPIEILLAYLVHFA